MAKDTNIAGTYEVSPAVGYAGDVALDDSLEDPEASTRAQS